MSNVMTIRQAQYIRNPEAFFFLLDTPEIKARRADRMKRDAEQARLAALQEEREHIRAEALAQGRAQGREEARKEYKRRAREQDMAHDQELKDLGASLAGGVAMMASLIGLAMLV